MVLFLISIACLALACWLGYKFLFRFSQTRTGTLLLLLALELAVLLSSLFIFWISAMAGVSHGYMPGAFEKQIDELTLFVSGIAAAVALAGVLVFLVKGILRMFRGPGQ